MRPCLSAVWSPKKQGNEAVRHFMKHDAFHQKGDYDDFFYHLQLLTDGSPSSREMPQIESLPPSFTLNIA